MRRKLGRQGEDRAVEWLKKKGYKILDQNYYTRYGELDIICEKSREIVFVEVKTRRSSQFGSPEEAVTYRKIQHMKHAALLYLSEKNIPYRGMRFDVIAIRVSSDGSENINHIENAF